MMSLLVAGLIWAEALPTDIVGLSLNPRLHLMAEGASIFKNEQFEVHIKSVKVPNQKVADQKARAELTNIQNLYKARGNPYQGQVSELVECGKSLLPKVEEISVQGRPVSLLSGGASPRRMFGVCAPDELFFWGGFFQFFHAPTQTSVEVRVFLKKEEAKSLGVAHGKIKKFSQELFE